jgi:hypothetical protein
LGVSRQGEFKNTIQIFLQKVHVENFFFSPEKSTKISKSVFPRLLLFNRVFECFSAMGVQKHSKKNAPKIVSKSFYKKFDQKSKTNFSRFQTYLVCSSKGAGYIIFGRYHLLSSRGTVSHRTPLDHSSPVRDILPCDHPGRPVRICRAWAAAVAAARFALLCQCSLPSTTAIARPRSGLYCRLSTDEPLCDLPFNSPKQGRRPLAGLCWHMSQAGAPVPQALPPAGVRVLRMSK